MLIIQKHQEVYRDNPNDNIVNSESFNSKIRVTRENNAEDNLKDVKMLVLLKYFSNFWRTLTTSSISCEINLI